MKDEQFYGSPKGHPKAGTEMVKIGDKFYSKVDIDYLKSQSKTEQSSFPKKIDPSDSYRNDQLERLNNLKCNRTRLQKQIDQITSVIQHIEKDLGLEDN